MFWLDPYWERRAACRPGNVAGISFHFGQPDYDANAAKCVCAMCPVRVDCLHVAMELEAKNRGHYRFGVWGGKTATERDRLALEDDRYAIYPEGFTELEILTIFTEVTSDMKVKFAHNVDGFQQGAVADMKDEIADAYVSNGHATAVEAPKPKVEKPEAPKGAVTKKA